MSENNVKLVLLPFGYYLGAFRETVARPELKGV